MPLRDIDDLNTRLRSQPPAGSRPPLIDDFRAGQQRHFPNVGTTLPLRYAPVQPVEPRPRQPLAHTASLAGSAASPVIAVVPAAVPQAQPMRPKAKRRWITKKRVALVVLLLALAAGGWFGYKFLANVQKVFHGNIFSVLTTTKLKGEDTGRVNILLAGNSADDPYHNGAELTDSIMVVSIDVKNHTAFMISVPRDLWVNIPGYGHAKINEAYVDGENGDFATAGYPSGGMGLLEETIQQTFGIKANYYALVDYNALRDAVNAVGGIDYMVASDDPRGLYDPSKDYSTHGPLVKLTNGVHHLNGAQALGLARARGDAYGSYGFARSDFDRTEHQREIILALKSKILSAGTLANPVALSNLFDSVGKNVRTDFSLSEVRRLYDIGKDIKNTDIQSIGLNDVHGVNYLASYQSPRGQSALIPAAGLDDFSKIQAYITKLLTSNPVVREGAEVVALNGTSTSGIAAKAETVLTAKGISVKAIGDASTPETVTTIIDNSHKTMPATLALLKQLYGSTITTTNPYSAVYTADFIVVLGNDQVTPSSTAP